MSVSLSPDDTDIEELLLVLMHEYTTVMKRRAIAIPVLASNEGERLSLSPPNSLPPVKVKEVKCQGEGTPLLLMKNDSFDEE